MKKWADYYDRFYDWLASTQASRLTDFGLSREICEIAQNLCEDKLAQRLIKKAFDAGVRFQPDSEVTEEQPPKIGFFTPFALKLGLEVKSKPHKHNGKYNGDCANCPAHYGYL